MKHNTHIYLAAKAIEFIRQSSDCTYKLSGNRKRYISGGEKSSERRAAVHRQRIFAYYEDKIEDASWAPDDILHDQNPFHIFKLFCDDEFPGHTLQDRQQFTRDGLTFYKFSGGLPYRVDHLANTIADMLKLRDYNDQYSLKQIMYLYLLISHYVVDAHVPMHCDLRDDPPGRSSSDGTSHSSRSGKPEGNYCRKSAHKDLEKLWDDAVTAVAIREKILERTWLKEPTDPNFLSESVTFGLKHCRDREITVRIIPKNDLMDFMVDVCITGKLRARRLFPVADPQNRDDTILPDITREIFADCIGNLMAVWRYIWTYYQT